MATQKQQTGDPDNELAHFAEKALPFLEEHGNKILLGLAAVLLIVAAGIFVSRSSTASSAAGWTQMAAASSAGEYATIAEDFEGSSVGNWARLVEGDSYLQSGIQLLFTDRDASQGELEQALQTYEKLLNTSGISDVVREKAMFGRAQAVEARSDGDTEEAIAAYKALLDAYPESGFKIVAEQRVESLEREETKEFYAWFHQQNPEPPDLETPNDGQAAPDFPPSLTPSDPVLPDVPLLLENVMPASTLGAEVDEDSPVPPSTPESTEADSASEDAASEGQ